MSLRVYLANKMRRWADRLDHAGAPKATSFFFTFEKYKGVEFNHEGRGCRLWYLTDTEYDKAFSDSQTMAPENSFLNIIRAHTARIADDADVPRTLFDSGPTSGDALRAREGFDGR